MRANVYVDGFNLYYSALRRGFPDCKWLDVRALTETLFPNDEIARALYFSARVIARADDPQEARVRMHWQAARHRPLDSWCVGSERSSGYVHGPSTTGPALAWRG